MAAPIIGITTYRQPASWSDWVDVPADLLPSGYARSVERAGGIPLLVPPVGSAAAADAVVARLDGLLLAGGADVNPARYGERPHLTVRTWYDDRDASELWLVESASRSVRPVLGICRGMQVLAVAAGGSLIQNLPDRVEHSHHHGGPNSYSIVPVTVERGYRISSLVGDRVDAACHHHQAVSSAPGYVVTAHDRDGVAQAMELPGDRFVIGVQWHPETGNEPGLFEGFVAAAHAS